MDMIKACMRYVRKKREREKINHLPRNYNPTRVIDIGCGMYPFPEFVFRNAQRFFADYDLSNDPSVSLGLNGNFIQVDVENLPFEDKAFDFIHCSNVLEHVCNPDKGFLELRRISENGYIECPSAFRENIICHTGAHQWIVDFKGEGVELAKPRETHVFGLKVLPLTWLHRILIKVRIFWKIFDFIMQDCFGLMYRYVKF